MKNPTIVRVFAVFLVFTIILYVSQFFQKQDNNLPNRRSVDVVDVISTNPIPPRPIIPDVTLRKNASTIITDPDGNNIASITSEFLQDNIPFPAGFKNLRELNDQFISEKKTENSIALSNRLKNIILQVNNLGPEAADNGIECRKTLCRVVSSFSPRSSIDNVNASMRQLQRLKPGLFKNAGLGRPLVISTRVSKTANGPAFLSFVSI